MPKFPSPRLVLRTRADGSKTLFTKNLAHLRSKLRPRVLNAFTRAFVHVDRLDSLVAFAYLNQAHVFDRPDQHARNHFTFLAFLMGTMFELSLVLKSLRGYLVKEKLITPAEWELHLPGWDTRWRSDQLCADFRNKISFHVDESLVEMGLNGMAAKNKAEIYRAGPSDHRQDGSFPLGQMAVLNGLGVPEEQLVALVSRPIPDLQVYEPLSRLFSLVLDRVDLTPKVETEA